MRGMGYACVRGKRKSGLITMEVWDAVEWTGLARMKPETAVHFVL